MKKLMPLLALLVVLAGCSGGTEEVPAEGSKTPSPTPEDRVTATVAPTAEPVPTVLPEPTAVEPLPSAVPTPTQAPEPTPEATVEPVTGPSDEEVLLAYEKAVEAYSWFDLTTMPLDYEDQQTVGELVYSRVDYEGIDTMADLRGYLKGIFSDGLVEQLLPAGSIQYVELDGVLYGLDGGRGTDITRGGESVQVLRDEDPSRCIVRVTVDHHDPEQDFAIVGSEIYDFPYEQVGDQWIFTDFSLVR